MRACLAQRGGSRRGMPAGVDALLQITADHPDGLPAYFFDYLRW